MNGVFVMSRTYRIYNVDKRFPGFDKYRKFNPFWYRHDSVEVRKHSNRDFRHKEKQYFERFGECLVRSKDRGWRTW